MNIIPKFIRDTLNTFYPDGYVKTSSHSWNEITAVTVRNCNDIQDRVYVFFDSRKDTAWIEHSFVLEGYLEGLDD